MEENTLVREITPEEVKSVDPFEISYIAMKDGTILMVLDKNENLKNSFHIKESLKELEEQSSPEFNIKGKKTISFIKPKIEIEQNQNDEDYNVYYSNNKSSVQDKLYTSNDSVILNNNNNDSFFSFDNTQNNNFQKTIKPTIINDDNINNAKIINDNDYQNNNNQKKIITNNIVNYTNNNLENKSPYYVVNRKYHFYKKSSNIPISESKFLNKTYNPHIHSKRQNNLYVLNKANNNISIAHSKYSKSNNTNFKYIRTHDDSLNEDNNINYYSINEKLNEKNLRQEADINKVIVDNNFNNNYNYEIYNNQSSLIDFLNSNKGKNYYRSKTPSIEIRNLRRNINKNKIKNKNNKIEIKQRLTINNHKFYERKELSVPKYSKSNYIKMKDSYGQTIHVFED